MTENIHNRDHHHDRKRQEHKEYLELPALEFLRVNITSTISGHLFSSFLILTEKLTKYF